MRLACHWATRAINEFSSRTPFEFKPFVFCQPEIDPAKSVVAGSYELLSVWPISRSYKYQPCCCLLPNVQVRSFRSSAFCAAASANGPVGAGLAAVRSAASTVGLTSDSVFEAGDGGVGDWPRLLRAANETKPTTPASKRAVSTI